MAKPYHRALLPRVPGDLRSPAEVDDHPPAATPTPSRGPSPNFVIEMAIVHLGDPFPTFVITNDGVDGMFDYGGEDKRIGSSQRVTRPKAGSNRCRDLGDGPDIAQRVEQKANCRLGIGVVFT